MQLLMEKLSHFSHVKKNLPNMVDISHKTATHRVACAESKVFMSPELFDQISNDELMMAKGPVFSTAIVAGTYAVKNTALLIPFCHQLLISSIDFTIEPEAPNQLKISCRVKNTGNTGVEMEALCGASVAALTVYDMCKSFGGHLSIGEVALVQKSGGTHDFDHRKQGSES